MSEIRAGFSADEAQAHAEYPERTPRSLLPHGDALITLIEDEDDIREALQELLHDAGYGVRAYADAAQALAEMECGRRPDLVLLDLMMPGMNGWEFRVAQRKNPALADIPVIALSANNSPYAASIDADAYLHKPVPIERLRAVIERVLLASERKRLAAKAMELERVRALGMLVASVAHEINNPLTYVIGNLDLASMHSRTATGAAAALGEYIAGARDGAQRISYIVRLLSTFVSGDSSPPGLINPLHAIDAAARLAMHHIRHRARLVCDLRPVSSVRANEARLAQVFLNLLTNAAQAIEPGAIDRNQIRVRAWDDDSHVTIEVSDTGCGIPKELASRIFEPFYTTKEVGRGTGLGLSQVFGFAKQSGGEIGIESKPGQGAKFLLYLPHAEAAEVPVEPKESESSAERGTPVGCVLLVEDNQLVGEFAAQLLVDLGYANMWVSSGQEALARIDANPRKFDVVFTDVVMPGMSGIELAEVMRARHPDVPVVLTSGYSHVLAAEGTHGFHLLQKPYTGERLARAIKRARAGNRKG